MTTTAGLTEKTRKKLKETVDKIRVKLIEDLYLEANRKFSFEIKDRSILKLSSEEVYQYKLLSEWCNDSIRQSKDFKTNVKTLIKESAYTLTNRLFILRQMEARGLQNLQVLTGGKESPGYKEYRDFCPELCQGPDEGYYFLLKQIFDKIALDLPGFFSNTGILHIFDIPGPTLFWLVDQLNQKELEGAWTDDTTIGWLYQYWNDPERMAVKDKLEGQGQSKGKVETEDLAPATQLFTVRYMVEWVIQNTLGTQWLAICENNNWIPKAIDTIEVLEIRRQEWREKLKNKEVFEDMAMPIESEEEEHWKFYVKQEIPEEVIKAAPVSLKEVKVLDPACGSGHFLVYAFDLLYAFYQEEAKLNGKEIKTEEIVNNILSYNLHGIDIDPRAVQLAAAALYLKAKEKAPKFQASQINLVATDLGLANLKTDDPSIQEFVAELAKENILPNQSLSLIESLKGADYLGSLLQVDKSLSKIKEEMPLFQLQNNDNNIDEAFSQALKKFILKHDQGDDLGVKTRAEQLAKGLRLVEVLGQKYQVVCANPPYIAKSKCHKDIEGLFIEGASELYESFGYRAKSLLKKHGFLGFLITHNFMFISKFKEFREYLLDNGWIKTLSQLGVWTFPDLSNAGFIGFSMFSWINECPSDNIDSQYFRVGNGQYQLDTRYKIPHILSQVKKFSFRQSKFSEIEGSPMIYWWSEEFRQVYLKSPKIGEVGEVRQGMATSNNNRFLRELWEVSSNKVFIKNYKSDDNKITIGKWFPYLKGAKGKRWFEPLSSIINYFNDGFEVKRYADVVFTSWTGRIINRHLYFKQGLAFSYIGTNGFQCRLRKYESVFDISGSSIFLPNPEKSEVLLSSIISGYVSQSINPTINNQVGDIAYLPIFDIIPDWKKYYDDAESLYDNYFASHETCIEYSYQDLDREHFEASEILIRTSIDNDLYAQFLPETVLTIKEEVGESTGNYKKLTDEELKKASEIYPNFADIYLNGPYKYEFGEIQLKKDGNPDRGGLQSLEDLCHEFQLHPESIIELRKYLGIQRKGDRQDEAYRHFAWSVGVALSRFDAQTGGLVDMVTSTPLSNLDTGLIIPKALSNGMFFLSERGQIEELQSENNSKDNNLIEYLKSILVYKHGQEKADNIWQEIKQALIYDCKEELTSKDRQKLNFNHFLREKCFDFHKSVYENRPIYFPLSSPKKTYVVV